MYRLADDSFAPREGATWVQTSLPSRRVNDVLREAAVLRITEITLRRARKALGGQVRREGFGKDGRLLLALPTNGLDTADGATQRNGNGSVHEGVGLSVPSGFYISYYSVTTNRRERASFRDVLRDGCRERKRQPADRGRGGSATHSLRSRGDRRRGGRFHSFPCSWVKYFNRWRIVPAVNVKRD